MATSIICKRFQQMEIRASTEQHTHVVLNRDWDIYFEGLPVVSSLKKKKRMQQLSGFTFNMSPSVLVVGAGELGTAVLEALSKHPNRQGGKLAVLRRQETIESHDASKQKAVQYVKALGAELEAGDFVNDPIPELVAIFKKYDIVVQCGGYGMAPGTQIRVTQAALEAGVPRYFPWQFGVDYEVIGKGSSQEMFDEMLEVRKMLRAQHKTNWTIISTGLFMSFLFLPDFGVFDFKNRTIRALGGWDTCITVTLPKDIGTMVAEMVYRPENTDNRVVYIGGDTITYEQFADIADAAYDTKFERQVLDIPYLRNKLKNEPQNLWLKYQIIFGEGTGCTWPMEKTLNQQRGIKLTGVDAFVKENKDNLISGV